MTDFFLIPQIINSDDSADFITRHTIESLSGRDYEFSILCIRSLNVKERIHLDILLNLYLYVQANVVFLFLLLR